MKNLFIPYELAIIAKEKGFGEISFAFYNQNTPIRFFSDYDKTETNKLILDGFVVNAPLYQQIVDWLREQHDLFITISYYKSEGYYSSVGNLKKDSNDHNFISKDCENYYEALNKAIEEAFKLI